MHEHKNSMGFTLLINGLLLIVSLFAITNVLVFVQRHYVPIVEYMRIDSVYHDDDYNHDITGVLKKPSWIVPELCKWVRNEASMVTPTGWQRIAIEHFDQPKDASATRNPGESVFGVWKLKTGSYTDAKRIRLDVRHNCLLLPIPESWGFDFYLLPAKTTLYLDLNHD